MEEFKFTFVARILVEERILTLIRVTSGIWAKDSNFSQEVPIHVTIKFMYAFLNEIFADSPQFKLCPEKGRYSKFFARVG